MYLLWRNLCSLYGNLNISYNSANIRGHYLSPTHQFQFLMSLRLYSVLFVMEEKRSQSREPPFRCMILVDTRVGVVAACGLFLEWRTSQGHLNESVVIQMQALFMCAWPCVLWAKGTLHHRVQDGSTCSCGWAVSSYFFSSLNSCHCVIFTSVSLFFAHGRALLWLKLLKNIEKLALNIWSIQNLNHFFSFLVYFCWLFYALAVLCQQETGGIINLLL